MEREIARRSPSLISAIGMLEDLQFVRKPESVEELEGAVGGPIDADQDPQRMRILGERFQAGPELAEVVVGRNDDVEHRYDALPGRNVRQRGCGRARRLAIFIDAAIIRARC